MTDPLAHQEVGDSRGDPDLSQRVLVRMTNQRVLPLEAVGSNQASPWKTVRRPESSILLNVEGKLRE